MRNGLAIATLLSLGLASSAPLPQDAANRPNGFVLDAGDHVLRDVLLKAARFLGRNYILPPEIDQVPTTVQLQKKLILDAVGCEEVVSQLSYAKGFVVAPMDRERGLYEVIALRGSRRNEVWSRAVHLSPDEIVRKSRNKMTVVTSVELQHIDAARASQQLRPFFAAGASSGMPLQFGNAGSSRSVLLQGFTDQVAAAIRLLREVDKPEPEGKTQYATHEPLATRNHNKIVALTKRVATLEQQLAAMSGAKAK